MSVESTRGIFSPRGSILDRVPTKAQSIALSESQAKVDGLVSSGISTASDLKTMTSLLGAGLAGKMVRLGSIAAFGKALTHRVLFASSHAASLAGESAVFASMERGSAQMEGQFPAQSFQKDWASAAITLGSIKLFGGAARSQNLIVQHLMIDMGMVAGHHVGHALDLTEKPQGSLAQQMIQAEGTNLGMKASMALLHGVVPRLSAIDKSLDLTLKAQVTNFFPSAPAPFSGGLKPLAEAAAAAGGRLQAFPVKSIQPRAMGLLWMAVSKRGLPGEGERSPLPRKETQGIDRLISDLQPLVGARFSAEKLEQEVLKQGKKWTARVEAEEAPFLRVRRPDPRRPSNVLRIFEERVLKKNPPDLRVDAARLGTTYETVRRIENQLKKAFVLSLELRQALGYGIQEVPLSFLHVPRAFLEALDAQGVKTLGDLANFAPPREITRLFPFGDSINKFHQELLQIGVDLSLSVPRKSSTRMPDLPIEVLGLTDAIENRLLNAGIRRLSDLVESDKSSLSELRDKGDLSSQNLKRALASRGLAVGRKINWQPITEVFHPSFPLDRLDLGNKIPDLLHRANILTIGDLLKNSAGDLECLGLSPYLLTQLKRVLAEKGLVLAGRGRERLNPLDANAPIPSMAQTASEITVEKFENESQMNTVEKDPPVEIPPLRRPDKPKKSRDRYNVIPADFKPAFEMAAQRVKLKGRPVTFKVFARLAHRIFCVGLPKGERPHWEQFYDIIVRSSAIQESLGLLESGLLQRQKKVKVNPKRLRLVLENVLQSLKQKKKKIYKIELAALVFERYSQGLPENQIPALGTIQFYFTGSAQDTNLVRLIERSGVWVLKKNFSYESQRVRNAVNQAIQKINNKGIPVSYAESVRTIHKIHNKGLKTAQQPSLEAFHRFLEKAKENDAQLRLEERSPLIQKLTPTTIDPQRLRAAFEEALRRIKKEGKVVYFSHLADQAHEIYCEGLVEGDKPSRNSFRNALRPGSPHSDLLARVEASGAIKKIIHSDLDPRRSKAAFEKAVQRVKKIGIKVNYAQVADLAHEIYCYGLVEAEKPWRRAFLNLLHGSYGNRDLIDLVQSSGVAEKLHNVKILDNRLKNSVEKAIQIYQRRDLKGSLGSMGRLVWEIYCENLSEEQKPSLYQLVENIKLKFKARLEEVGLIEKYGRVRWGGLRGDSKKGRREP